MADKLIIFGIENCGKTILWNIYETNIISPMDTSYIHHLNKKNLIFKENMINFIFIHQFFRKKQIYGLYELKNIIKKSNYGECILLKCDDFLYTVLKSFYDILERISLKKNWSEEYLYRYLPDKKINNDIIKRLLEINIISYYFVLNNIDNIKILDILDKPFGYKYSENDFYYNKNYNIKILEEYIYKQKDNNESNYELITKIKQKISSLNFFYELNLEELLIEEKKLINMWKTKKY